MSIKTTNNKSRSIQNLFSFCVLGLFTLGCTSQVKDRFALQSRGERFLVADVKSGVQQGQLPRVELVVPDLSGSMGPHVERILDDYILSVAALYDRHLASPETVAEPDITIIFISHYWQFANDHYKDARICGSASNCGMPAGMQLGQILTDVDKLRDFRDEIRNNGAGVAPLMSLPVMTQRVNPSSGNRELVPKNEVLNQLAVVKADFIELQSGVYSGFEAPIMALKNVFEKNKPYLSEIIQPNSLLTIIFLTDEDDQSEATDENPYLTVPLTADHRDRFTNEPMRTGNEMTFPLQLEGDSQYGEEDREIGSIENINSQLSSISRGVFGENENERSITFSWNVVSAPNYAVRMVDPVNNSISHEYDPSKNPFKEFDYASFARELRLFASQENAILAVASVSIQDIFTLLNARTGTDIFDRTRTLEQLIGMNQNDRYYDVCVRCTKFLEAFNEGILGTENTIATQNLDIGDPRVFTETLTWVENLTYYLVNRVQLNFPVDQAKPVEVKELDSTGNLVRILKEGIDYSVEKKSIALNANLQFLSNEHTINISYTPLVLTTGSSLPQAPGLNPGFNQ